jgi:hypothetical protein
MASTATIYRADMGRIQVSVTGVNLDSIAWDTLSEAQLNTAAEFYHPGNMGPGQNVGGLRTPGDITITRAWSSALYPVYMALYNAAGFTPMTVTYTPLDGPNVVSQKPLTASGILTSVSRPAVDAATSTIQYLTIVMGPHDSLSQN